MIDEQKFNEYLQEQDQERSDAIDAVLGGLTERERGLVHDAAVMGYVQASQDIAVGKTKIPKDSVIIRMVVDACLSFPDLYPTINNTPEVVNGICVRCGSGVLDGEHLRKDQPPCYPTPDTELRA